MPFTMPSVGTGAKSAVLSGYSASNPFPPVEGTSTLPKTQEASRKKNGCEITSPIALNKLYHAPSLLYNSEDKSYNFLKRLHLALTVLVCLSKYYTCQFIHTL